MKYTIQKVSFKNDWDSKFGPMSTYNVSLAGEDGSREIAQMNKKQGNVPQEGQEVWGTLQETAYGLKFKSEAPPVQAGSIQPVTRTTKKDDSMSKADWQKKDQMMARMSAMKAASSYYQATAGMNDDKHEDPMLRLAQRCYDWINNDGTDLLP